MANTPGQDKRKEFQRLNVWHAKRKFGNLKINPRPSLAHAGNGWLAREKDQGRG